MDQLTRLALEARDGDEVSLAGFVRVSQPEVRRLVTHLVDSDDVDDVVQEVYLRAIPALGRYRGDAPARYWLLSIARRSCADAIRARQRWRRLRVRAVTSPEPQPDSSRALELSESLGALDSDRRIAFVVTQILGLSYGEAAAVLNIPVGTVRSRVARARQQLVSGWPAPTAAEEA